MDALKGKMIEFNAKAPTNLQLGEEQIHQLVDLGTNCSALSTTIFPVFLDS